MRVLLVDDHTLVRQALRMLLEDEPDIEVVGEAANGREGVELTDHLYPDVVLLDMSMPVLDGLQAARLIHAAHQEVCIIGLSMHEHLAERMQAAGAMAYVRKDQLPDQLVTIMWTCYRHLHEHLPPAAAV